MNASGVFAASGQQEQTCEYSGAPAGRPSHDQSSPIPPERGACASPRPAPARARSRSPCHRGIQRHIPAKRTHELYSYAILDRLVPLALCRSFSPCAALLYRFDQLGACVLDQLVQNLARTLNLQHSAYFATFAFTVSNIICMLAAITRVIRQSFLTRPLADTNDKKIFARMWQLLRSNHIFNVAPASIRHKYPIRRPTVDLFSQG